MENTGRITHGVSASVRRVLFGETGDESIDTELTYISQIDRAHLVMLVETGIVAHDRACSLLRAIDDLETSGFAQLRGREATRGLYLLYEDYLSQQLGAETGGILQTARSRNDLNATVLRLRLRVPYLRLSREALRLQAVLLRRAARFARITMPAYTHYQAALPVTYGHYLAGIAFALQRDCADFASTVAGLNICPLGAGAVGGTSLPIRPARTAQLLGFDQPLAHSIDMVASRDFILRMLATSAILGITLSRLSTDLLLWLTAEFGFLTLPDNLVGSSSMMPQKRNPYLLEHVQGRSSAPLGAFVGAATAMHAQPFTNTISVGTEAVSHIWDALRRVTEAVFLARVVVAGAIPETSSMLRRADEGYTTATELANRLVVKEGMAFRTAHHVVGSIIRAACDHHKESLPEAATRSQMKEVQAVSLEGLDAASVAQQSIYGGGPGSESFNSYWKMLRDLWSVQVREMQAPAQKWNAAEGLLNEAVRQLCAPPPSIY